MCGVALEAQLRARQVLAATCEVVCTVAAARVRWVWEMVDMLIGTTDESNVYMRDALVGNQV
jgi:hypothetical protein